MKLENLTFSIKKATGRGYQHKYPSIRVRPFKNHGKVSGVYIFLNQFEDIYSSNTHCRYAIIGQRLYFMFCSKNPIAYKLSPSSGKPTLSSKRMTVASDKELSKFIRDDIYTPKLDNECGLYYIEY